MYVVSEPRVIVGMLKTNLGDYPMLDPEFVPVSRNQDVAWVASIVDDEGFDNKIIFHGDFVMIPTLVPWTLDVKRVLTEEEQESYNLAEISSVE